MESSPHLLKGIACGFKKPLLQNPDDPGAICSEKMRVSDLQSKCQSYSPKARERAGTGRTFQSPSRIRPITDLAPVKSLIQKASCEQTQRTNEPLWIDF